MSILVTPVEVTRADELLHPARRLADLDAASVHADPNFEVSCRSGCGACCRQAVPVTRAEMRSIRAYIGELDADRREQIQRRIVETAARLAEHGITSSNIADGHDYFTLGIACPLLEDESCTVRPVRPLACREYLVTSEPRHCATLEPGQVKRVSTSRDVIEGFNRVSRALGEPERLALAPALGEPDPDVAVVTPKSGVAMMKLISCTGRY